MSEPKRWLDDPEAPELVRDHLQRALSVEPPAFDASAGLARFESAVEGTGGASGATASGAGALQLVVLGGVLVGAGIAAWVALSGPTEPLPRPQPPEPQMVQPETVVLVEDQEASPSTPPPVVPEEPPAVIDGEETPPVEATGPEPTTKAEIKKSSPAAKPPPAEPPDDSVRREIEALAHARKALGADPKRALALVEAADREFKNGMFGEERAAIRVMALASLGREDEAKRRGEKFLQRYPKSNFADRVRAAIDD